LELERLLLHPHEFGFQGQNVALESMTATIAALQTVLQGQPSELLRSTLWNGGFYLWRCGMADSIAAGIATAETLLTQGKVRQKLHELQQAIVL
jgi:anthranilate phosphoribosyltransferase